MILSLCLRTLRHLRTAVAFPTPIFFLARLAPNLPFSSALITCWVLALGVILALTRVPTLADTPTPIRQASQGGRLSNPPLSNPQFLYSQSSYSPIPTVDLPIYTDSLRSGWDDLSWATREMSAPEVVHSGSRSIRVTFGPFQAIKFHHELMSVAPYSKLVFWVNGGSQGGQQFTIAATRAYGQPLPGVPVTHYILGGKIPAFQWVNVSIPLHDLGITTPDGDLSDFSDFLLLDATSQPQPTLYLDDIRLVGQAAPTQILLSVDATKSLQPVADRQFGVNVAAWNTPIDADPLEDRLVKAGVHTLRFPGGSSADVYDWTHPVPGQNATPQLMNLATALHANAIVNVNYGTGTPEMAAAWAAYCNGLETNTFLLGKDAKGRDWKTVGYWAALRGSAPLAVDDGLNFLRLSHPIPTPFRDWQIGNECYGPWEADEHHPAHDAAAYAAFVQATMALLKQVDSHIRVLVPVTYGEEDWGSQLETVVNPVTKENHKGWTATLFSELSRLNAIPDGVTLNYYSQVHGPGSENDGLLLQSSATWPHLAGTIRSMLNQYFGEQAAAPIQLVCTEYSSVPYSPGKQSTSLVSGLYCADAFAALARTEFSTLVWWDMQNGLSLDQRPVSPHNSAMSLDSADALYGWRNYGDYGMFANGAVDPVPPGAVQNTPYPLYFAAKLLSHFASSGGTIVSATSNYVNLAVYACKQADNSLALLVINKHPVSDLMARLSVAGYRPASIATLYQYGKIQDNLQSRGAAVDLSKKTVRLAETPTLAGGNFSFSFPSYSMTVVLLTPEQPKLSSLSQQLRQEKRKPKLLKSYLKSHTKSYQKRGHK